MRTLLFRLWGILGSWLLAVSPLRPSGFTVRVPLCWDGDGGGVGFGSRGVVGAGSGSCGGGG